MEGADRSCVMPRKAGPTAKARVRSSCGGELVGKRVVGGLAEQSRQRKKAAQ